MANRSPTEPHVGDVHIERMTELPFKLSTYLAIWGPIEVRGATIEDAITFLCQKVADISFSEGYRSAKRDAKDEKAQAAKEAKAAPK